jgi:LEA14-like dessication related protein
MKKTIGILITLFVFSSCEFHEPSFSGLESYKIEKFENNELLVNLVFKLRNDNGFKIKVKPSKLSVFAEDVEMGTIFLDKKISFKRKTEGTYETKIRIKIADGAMFSMLKFAGKKELKLRFVGKIKGKVFFVSKKIPIDESKIVSPDQLNFKQFLGN